MLFQVTLNSTKEKTIKKFKELNNSHVISDEEIKGEFGEYFICNIEVKKIKHVGYNQVYLPCGGTVEIIREGTGNRSCQ